MYCSLHRTLSSTPPPPSFTLQVRQLHDPEPLMRARAAGVLFNVAGFGPDCRLAMLEQVTFPSYHPRQPTGTPVT